MNITLNTLTTVHEHNPQLNNNDDDDNDDMFPIALYPTNNPARFTSEDNDIYVLYCINILHQYITNTSTKYQTTTTAAVAAAAATKTQTGGMGKIPHYRLCSP